RATGLQLQVIKPALVALAGGKLYPYLYLRTGGRRGKCAGSRCGKGFKDIAAYRRQVKTAGGLPANGYIKAAAAAAGRCPGPYLHRPGRGGRQRKGIAPAKGAAGCMAE